MKCSPQLLAAAVGVMAVAVGCSEFSGFAKADEDASAVRYCRSGSAIKYNAPAGSQDTLGWRQVPRNGSCLFR